MIVPKLNEIDLDDIPERVREEMEFIPVEDVSEVLAHALMPKPVDKAESVAEPEPEPDEVSEPEPVVA